MAKHRTGSGAEETSRVRLSATDHGSLPSFMNQGGSRSLSSENNLPELLDQGGSTKRGDQMPAKKLKNMMGQ